MRLRCALLVCYAAGTIAASAQDAPDAKAAAAAAWEWAADANVFFGFNHQHRKFRDFSTWESQNWMMAGAERRSERDRVRLSAMLSFEAFTLEDIGSAQVFQTGETFRNAPLIDYQHPHDLIMGLGGDYQRVAGRATVLVGADLVGSPTLGPAPFMHRPSAIENPQAPLSHHYMDSSHITHGVVRGGLGAAGWMVEGSWFRGREPDEDRIALDLGALDSYAVRLSWRSARWAAQISGASLTQPERVTPYDATKSTASIARDGGEGARGVSWMAGFGQKREVHGHFEAYLFEATLRATAADIVYARAESVAKDVLDAGFHPTVFHQHRQSQVAAVTAGYVRNVMQTAAGTVGIGADVTAYGVPANLRDSYGAPLSFHVFLRYRAGPRPRSTHVHAH